MSLVTTRALLGVVFGLLSLSAGAGSLNAAEPATTPRNSIQPGALWPDDRGRHIQAHGGGILKQGDTYYWFGEDRSEANTRGSRHVACYASRDLINWEFRNQVFKSADPENLGARWVLERPKVFHNPKTGKYVMREWTIDLATGETRFLAPSPPSATPAAPLL